MLCGSHGSMHAMRGVPMGVTAAQLGHSDMRMTEKHYAHLAPSYIAETIRARFPTLGITKDGAVKALRCKSLMTVDQEVGGSNPPSCTKQINGLPKVSDRTR